MIKKPALGGPAQESAEGRLPPSLSVFLKHRPERRVDAEKRRFPLPLLAPGARKKARQTARLAGLFLHTVPPKLPGQSYTAPRRRQLLTQSREVFRRRPLRLPGKAEEAVRKNRLPGAAAR